LIEADTPGVVYDLRRDTIRLAQIRRTSQGKRM
jgi:hypothetical protein